MSASSVRLPGGVTALAVGTLFWLSANTCSIGVPEDKAPMRGDDAIQRATAPETIEKAKTLISDVDLARRHPFAKRPYTDEAWLTKVDQMASDLFDRPNTALLPFRNEMVAKLSSALFLRCSSDQLVSFWRREWKSGCTRNALGEAMSINLVQLRLQQENLLAQNEKFNPSAPLWTGPEAADGLDMDRIVYSAILHKKSFFQFFIASDMGWHGLHPSKKQYVDGALHALGIYDAPTMRLLLKGDAPDPGNTPKSLVSRQ